MPRGVCSDCGQLKYLAVALHRIVNGERVASRLCMACLEKQVKADSSTRRGEEKPTSR